MSQAGGRIVVMVTFLKYGLPEPFNPWPQRMQSLCPASGKIRWLTERDAAIAERHLGRVGGWYLCDDCGHWHVTRQTAGLQEFIKRQLHLLERSVA